MSDTDPKLTPMDLAVDEYLRGKATRPHTTIAEELMAPDDEFLAVIYFAARQMTAQAEAGALGAVTAPTDLH